MRQQRGIGIVVRAVLAEIGLVPDFPFVHFVPVTGDDRLDEFQPGFHGRFVGKNFRPETFFSAVQGIAVSEVDPGLHPLFQHSVDDMVDPREVVAPFLLFAAGPAALNTCRSYSQFAQIRFVAVEIGVVPVERLATDRPVGSPQFVRRACRQCTDQFQFGAGRLHFFPREGPMRSVVSGRCGDRQTGHCCGHADKFAHLS